jgi:hypothetical protein
MRRGFVELEPRHQREPGCPAVHRPAWRPEDAGHGSLTTTQRYLHPDERSITGAGDALTAHLSVRRSPDVPQLWSASTTYGA